jgi:hypothetical protein
MWILKLLHFAVILGYIRLFEQFSKDDSYHKVIAYLVTRIYGQRDPSRWPRGTLYPHKLAITLPTSGGRLVVLVRSRTKTMEFSFFFFF